MVVVKMNEEEILRYNVKVGGGIWEGIQTTLLDPNGGSVIFRAPDGALLCRPVDKCTTADVRMEIAEHNQRRGIRPLRIQKSVLVHILDKLTELAEEVKKIIEEKR